MEKKQTCCFAGHRRLPQEKTGQIVRSLDREIERLIGQGVTTFISGGAIGFDMIAAWLIVAKKEMWKGKGIRLVLALPYRDHDAQWSTEQRQLLHGLMAEADEIVYVSEEYGEGCMKKRDCYMVDRSGYCVCALVRAMSGTGRMVKFAKREGVTIINLA